MTIDKQKMDIVEFRKRLKMVLRYKTWNQTDLAKEAGLTTKTISRWMNEGNPPSIKSIRKISKATGCNPQFLLGNEEAMFLARSLTYAELHRFWITIERIMKDLGWTKKKLSLRTRIFEKDIDAWENLKQVPTDECLTRIAEATGCRREYLLTWKGPRWQEGREPKPKINEVDKLKKIVKNLERRIADLENTQKKENQNT